MKKLFAVLPTLPVSAVLPRSCGDKDEHATESASAETSVTITSSGGSDYRPAPLEGARKERVKKKTERPELVRKETKTQNLDLKFI